MIASWDHSLKLKPITLVVGTTAAMLYIYISQNYFRLPRQTVLENVNLIILFRQDAKNLNHIYTDHCGDEMPFAEFKTFCRKVWNAAPFNFVTIDLTSDKLHGKYRKNLDWFYYPISERHALES